MAEPTLTADRPILITLTQDEAKVLQAAVYNGQLSGKIKSFSGLTPSKTAEIANDLFDRLRWLLDENYDRFLEDKYKEFFE